jgi:hypothetical protein
MILIVCIIFATVMSISLARSKTMTIQKLTKSSDQSEGDVLCQVSTEKTWARSGRARVSVVFESRARQAMKIAVVPAFHLTPAHRPKTEWTYDALWNLEGDSLRVGSTALVQIAPKGRNRTEVDASILTWSRRNSPLLPHSKLFDSVPAGKYILWLDLTASDGTIVCSSLKTAVEIK